MGWFGTSSLECSDPCLFRIDGILIVQPFKAGTNVMGQSSLFSHGSIFTVARKAPSGEKEPPGEIVLPGRKDQPPNSESFDLAVVEFKDNGCLVGDVQKDAMLECITAARRSNPNGALVVVFVHGWHCSAQWEWDKPNGRGDRHFAGFRKVLMTLALREAERYVDSVNRGRRVVGVYLAWHGDPPSWPRILGRTPLSFGDRYRTAKRIADGEAIQATIREIIARTKGSLKEKQPASPLDQPAAPLVESQPASPLILAGHSMGALMLETVLLALLTQGAAQKAVQPDSYVQVTTEGRLVSFPDLVIGLNSAGDSRITKAIISELELREMSKLVRAEQISYSPPLFVSVTATADYYTKVIWRLVPSNWGRWTVGHDRTLFTHTFDTMQAKVLCPQRNKLLDFGQNWACLRHPHPTGAPSPRFWIDLP